MLIVLTKEEQRFLNPEDIKEIEKTVNKQFEALLDQRIKEKEENKKSLKTFTKLGEVKYRRHNYNHFYFDSLNDENCYWGGFIAADGYIETSRPRIGIKIQWNDRYHLELFKTHCGYTGKVNEIISSTNKSEEAHQARLLFLAEDWLEPLKNHFSIKPNKSLTLEPPNLTIHQSLAFIKGYIDGNGSVIETPDSFRIEACGSEKIIYWLKNVINSTTAHLKRNDSENVRSDKVSSKLFRYQVAGDQALELIKLMKEIETPYLERKWSKVFNLIS